MGKCKEFEKFKEIAVKYRMALTSVEKGRFDRFSIENEVFSIYVKRTGDSYDVDFSLRHTYGTEWYWESLPFELVIELVEMFCNHAYQMSVLFKNTGAKLYVVPC